MYKTLAVGVAQKPSQSGCESALITRSLSVAGTMVRNQVIVCQNPKASSTSRDEAEWIASIVVVNAIESNYVTDDRHLLVLVAHLHFADFNLRVLSTDRS